MKKILVLNFHELRRNIVASRGVIKDLYSYDISKFREILEIVRERKIPVVTLDDLTGNKVPADNSVIITFDDGNKSDLEFAYPLLDEFNLHATFFISTNKLSESQMSWEQIVELSKRKNVAIGSHGVTHQRLTRLSLAECDFEFAFSKETIERKINMQVDYFSFPFGEWNKSIAQLAKNVGYKGVLTTNVQMNIPEKHPFVIHRWSIKSNTDVGMVEKMIRFNNWAVESKSWESKFKKFGKRFIGDKLVDRLNLLNNQIGG